MGSSGRRPISLQKRHRITDVHLKMLKEHSLRSLQLPYVLDSDEEAALHKVIHEPLFLLGRSGSGKTSVQTHALYCWHKAPLAWFEDGAEKAGPAMLVTRAWAASCSDHVQQIAQIAALKYFRQEVQAMEDVFAKPASFRTVFCFTVELVQVCSSSSSRRRSCSSDRKKQQRKQQL